MNKLRNETSPYLQQHAHNPVNWYPWSEEALEVARRDNKPILLSIGYAACHWCHVMAHESFEDADTAALMNELFINIKVDREERPDLDKIYQTTHHLLTQQNGGWPLTVFLNPHDQVPFFSGTYFPREAKYQLPAFKDVLQQLSDAYHQRGADIKQLSMELMRILNPPAPAVSDVRMNAQPIQHALQSLQRDYDNIHGGFGGAPKFPQPTRLEFLLLHDSPMAHDSLRHMAEGGIYDQLGGGFFRYSVDPQWQIPHFEKMLYDNAQLLYLYTLASQTYQEPMLANVARATANWVISCMQAPDGGYYASMDADSEGHEGLYYLWNQAELKTLLSADEYALIQVYYGLDKPANFENQWHLTIHTPLSVMAEKLKLTLAEITSCLNSAKKKMLASRTARVSPTIDTKILTAWNALMIKAMLSAGALLNEPQFIQSAERAILFIQEKLWSQHRLMATYKNTASPAYLDDYAYLIDALITHLHIQWNQTTLNFIIELTDVMLTHFADTTAGGFYFTANDHEQLLYRPKSMMDEAIPAGNAVAARSLQRLGYLLHESRYLQAAETTLHASWPLLTRYPTEHASLLIALEEYLHPPK